jgi:subtilisin family serine protease
VLIISIIFFFLFSRLSAQTVYPGFADGVVYFKVKDSAAIQLDYNNPPADLAALIGTYQVTGITRPFRTPDFWLQRIYKATLTNHAAVDNFITDLEALGYVEYAERSPLYEVTYVPNDYNAAGQWHLDRINAPSAWNISTGSAAVTIAIVDNGVNYMHEDLAANAWVNPGEIAGNGFDDDLNGYVDDIHGADIADNDGDPAPPANSNATPFAHGTHCAGIAAAVTDNAIGVSSIGYRTRIMAVKCASSSSAGGALSSVFDGVDYAISEGADIISMSFASAAASPTWAYLTTTANALGVVLVGAAGNDGTNTPYYPAASDFVIAVGATETNDSKASYSNYGNWVDVMAPGSGIYSTLPDGGNSYGLRTGTSMACPLVAGLAGLVLSLNPALTPAQVEDVIKGGCDNIDGMNSAYIGQLGWGRINAWQALAPVGIGSWAEVNPPFFVYPNMGDGAFWVDSDRDYHETVVAEVFNLQGDHMLAVNLPAPSQSGATELNLRDQLPNGGYVIRFYSQRKLIQSVNVTIASPY